MPASQVKTAKDEARWSDCKESVRKSHPGVEKSNPRRFYRLVSGCLQRRKAGVGGSRKGKWGRRKV